MMVPVFTWFDALNCYVQPTQIRHLKSGMRRAFRAAVRLAEQQIRKAQRDPTFRFPADLKPYDLRHAFATEMLKQTKGNYQVVAELLDQADTRHVRRYGLGAIPTVMKDAALAFQQGTAAVKRSKPRVVLTTMPTRPKGQSGGKVSLERFSS